MSGHFMVIARQAAALLPRTGTRALLMAGTASTADVPDADAGIVGGLATTANQAGGRARRGHRGGGLLHPRSSGREPDEVAYG